VKLNPGSWEMGKAACDREFADNPQLSHRLLRLISHISECWAKVHYTVYELASHYVDEELTIVYCRVYTRKWLARMK
jgi:hypothetical protein